MTIKEYIVQVKIENGLKLNEVEVENAIMKKAKKYLNGRDGSIDNELIKKWIIEIANSPESAKKDDEVELPVVTSKKEKVDGSWGQQTSLF